MKASNPNPNAKLPFHIHYGKNYWRIFTILLLIVILFYAIYSIQYVGLIITPLIPGCLFGLICIRFPKIYLYDDSFEIVKRGLIRKFSDSDIFKYNELSKVEFSEGYTDWNYLTVLAIFGGSASGGNSKSDQMVVKTKDGNSFYFNRFGSKAAFIKTIELIKSKLTVTTD